MISNSDEISDEQATFLEFMIMNIEARYPKYKSSVSNTSDTPRFTTEPKVYMYGSYAKGYANPRSDIDVAVIVPKIEGDWLTLSAELCHDMRKVSVLTEPVLMEQNEPSPLYRDVMRTGVPV